MKTAQQGDQVQVHYVKRFADGSVATSHGRAPLAVTVGADHSRLPGLGLALVGLAAGGTTKLQVAAEQAYGMHDPGRVRRLSRTRFRANQTLAAGAWARFTDHQGRRRRVRVLEDRGGVVVVDANHPRAGQAMELEVELLSIHGPGAHAPELGGPAAIAGQQGQVRIIAFDVDPASLVALRQAFPQWPLRAIDGATPGSLEQDWDPGPAQLLVVGARDSVAATLGLCRGLRSQLGRASTPLLVLVPPERESLVRAALEAGADGCLVLPVHAKDLVKVAARMGDGNQPGRHTLDLDRAQKEDRWRDDGGQG